MGYGEATGAGASDGRWLATYVERSSVTFARVAGLLGLVNAVVSTVIAGVGGSSMTKTALLACYVPAWAAMVAFGPQLRSAAARWSVTLPLLGGLGVLPTFWDGGAPSAFSGVTWWVCWVAATVASPGATLATVLVVAGLPAIAAYTTTSGSLSTVDGTAVLGSTIIPFFIGAIGLVVGGTFRWILDDATGRLAVAAAGGGASTAGLGRLLGGRSTVMPIGLLGASSWPLCPSTSLGAG